VSALTEARDADRAADQALTKAMAEYETAVRTVYLAELEARHPDDRMGRIAWLAAVIASNGADWSGGMANIMNLRATLRCNAAVNLLDWEMRHG
jgi:hypothetical protein